MLFLDYRNIEEIVYFGGQKSSRSLTYGTKQLLAREIEMEKMRRFEIVLSGAQEKQLASSKGTQDIQSPQTSAPKKGDSGMWLWSHI